MEAELRSSIGTPKFPALNSAIHIVCDVSSAPCFYNRQVIPSLVVDVADFLTPLGSPLPVIFILFVNFLSVHCGNLPIFFPSLCPSVRLSLSPSLWDFYIL